MYKLIIFDLDGTLINSLEDLANACNSALAHYGFPVHDIECYRYFVGDGVPMLIKRALPENDRNDETIARVKALFDSNYSKAYSLCTKPYDKINELLDALEEKKILTAVASNKPDNFTQTIVNEIFDGRFSYVSGKKEGFEKKPHPQIVLHIMDKLGVAPEDVLFVGDSSVDMKTAANAGVCSIGCTWGFRTESELRESGADHIVHHPLEILSVMN